MSEENEVVDANDLFVYEGPGYYIDRTGNRWLVGEDPDEDLMGINILDLNPIIMTWTPCGRVLGARGGHARDLVGRWCKERERKRGVDLALKFHRSN